MPFSQEYPIVTLCQVWNYSRSQLYYQPQLPADEAQIKDAIVKLAGEHPTYGYRRIAAMLKRGDIRSTTNEWRVSCGSWG